MPISSSSMENNPSEELSREEMYDQESIAFTGLTPKTAETLLKRLGGGVSESQKLLEGIGWRATILPIDGGVEVEFDAHNELLDDLIRRFEEWVDREVG